MRTIMRTKSRSVLIAGLLAGLAGQFGIQTAKAQQATDPATKGETIDPAAATPTGTPVAAPTPDAPPDPQAPATPAAPPATPPPVDLDTPFAYARLHLDALQSPQP